METASGDEVRSVWCYKPNGALWDISAIHERLTERQVLSAADVQLAMRSMAVVAKARPTVPAGRSRIMVAADPPGIRQS